MMALFFLKLAHFKVKKSMCFSQKATFERKIQIRTSFSDRQ
jgi:hypothetical protein